VYDRDTWNKIEEWCGWYVLWWWGIVPKKVQAVVWELGELFKYEGVNWTKPNIYRQSVSTYLSPSSPCLIIKLMDCRVILYVDLKIMLRLLLSILWNVNY